MTCFFVIFAFFINFKTEIDGKICFSIKKIISTREQHAEHPFAGRNTQQMALLIGFIRGFWSFGGLSADR